MGVKQAVSFEHSFHDRYVKIKDVKIKDVKIKDVKIKPF